ncbi:MAG: transcriptional regulator [Pseudonocardiales bacterium]|nr:transcriptional regulator [Pseudonocardiales bacterium]
MNSEVQTLCELPDPVERAKRTGDLLTRYQTVVTELSRIRREAVEELRATGMTQAEMAAALGMTRGRISQLVTTGPPPERAFLGTATVTVAFGGKVEAGKATPGPVVAQEDLTAYEQLRDLAHSVKLDTTYEVIPPPGVVRLNRDNLVVICGPRLSPLIGQVLESDPNLGFSTDEGGWHLLDRKTGRTYRSPMDASTPGDVGYLGRLPRPDGRGTFLYIAGIHAIGAGGIVHHLHQEMTELYREVRTKRFSTLIACQFDPHSREVLSSERLTPLYRPEA